MESNKRIYPRTTDKRLWITRLIAGLAVLLLAGGLLPSFHEIDLRMTPIPKDTPTPSDISFDDTPAVSSFELPETNWYALQLGAFQNEKAAKEVAQQFQVRGAAGFVWTDDCYRPLASAYQSRDDALIVRERLEQQYSIQTGLYTISFPSIAMELKGAQGQIDICKAAFLHAHDLTEFLSVRSVQLDRQEMTEQKVISDMNGLKEQLDHVCFQLKSRFRSHRPLSIELLTEMFEEFHDFCETIRTTENQTGLSTNIKYQTFASLQKLQKIYDTFSDRNGEESS